MQRVSSGRTRRRGSALVLALIVVILVGALGMGFLRLSSAVSARQSGDIDSMKAFYLCEAGLAEAYHAVRIGRTGQIGAEDAPAVYGNGLLWVDAVETEDSQVRLTSTALVGSGRSSLSLVVEPVEIPLGFFSEEDLVIDTVLLVDGYDSSGGGYADQALGEGEITVDPARDELFVDGTRSILFYEGTYYQYTSVDGNTYQYDATVTPAALEAHPSYGPGSTWNIHASQLDEADDLRCLHNPPPVVDDDDGGGGGGPSKTQYYGMIDYLENVAGPEVQTEAGPVAAIGVTTGGDGLLSSSGDILVQAGTGETLQIFGEVIPGPGGTVVQSGDVTITGGTAARTTEIELPAVEVPSVVMAPSVTHDGLLPLVVPPGESGHSQIVVADGAELILTGPSTVVIGDLVLEPGGLLTLDTRNGDVALYVTEGMDLQVGSTVENTDQEPTRTAIQVGAVASDEFGAPVKLNATSQFHGTIYAPDTEVDVGGDFEVYGGIVARKLNVGAGARLHFDNVEVSDSPIPKLVSWKIVELPASVAGLHANPFEVMGVDRETAATLADAHDLDFVHIMVDYVAVNGTDQTYTGFESEFDWSQVDEVTHVSREPTREKEEGSEYDPDEDNHSPPPIDPTAGVARTEVLNAIQNMHGSDLSDWLRTKYPLKSSEVVAMLDTSIMSSNEAQGVLEGTLIGNDAYIRLLSAPHQLTKGHLMNLLISKSPLPPEVMPYVENVDPSLLSPGQKNQVLDAQR